MWIYNNNVTTDTPVLHVLKGRFSMEFGIVGIKSLIGQRSKKSGKELNAYILHLVRDNPRDEGLQGHEVRQQFVDANLWPRTSRSWAVTLCWWALALI